MLMQECYGIVFCKFPDVDILQAVSGNIREQVLQKGALAGLSRPCNRDDGEILGSLSNDFFHRAIEVYILIHFYVNSEFDSKIT